ncbi:MAG TPA: hypothetical protein VMM92_16525 [Thermoanaerobaculia bacterium]|nr:hypothetical protein [Thermoanaerobaculia bacterium]
MENGTETRFDWSWLAGTYWFVPQPYLPALALDPGSGLLSWQVDQTVWHISGYETGYFWGVTAALTYDAEEGLPAHGPAARVGHLTMLGTVLPEGQVQMTFLSDRKGSSPTIGLGRIAKIGEAWSFGMQMSTERGNDRLLHWAQMIETHEGDASWSQLPGLDLSVPQMLSGAVYPRFEKG